MIFLIFFKEILPNDNVFIWLGSYDNTQINNVLILAGGEVLILKAIRRFNLNIERTRNDLINMSIEEFIDNYDLIKYLSIIEDFVKDLKTNKEDYENKIEEIIKYVRDGVTNRFYPPYLAKIEKYEGYIHEYKSMISKYLHNIHSIDHIKSIMKMCEEKIQMINKEQLKKENKKYLNRQNF